MKNVGFLYSRVVHISSRTATLILPKFSAELKQRVLNTKTVQEVKDLMQEFVE